MARPSVKEQIVQAGLKVLLDKGFNGVGVQEITESAGVPKGSFYNHFESKEALGAEIVERYGMDNSRRQVLLDRSLPGLKRLRGHFEGLNELFAKSKFERGCLLGNFSAELSNQSAIIREKLAELYGRWSKEIELAIEDGQKDGSIPRGKNAKQIAAFLLDAYEGALLRARVERSREPFDRFMAFAFEKILE
ncbi:MAG: TetR family transcriptional regulator C-terminal domain-containing protein [Pseudomonadota bacterium]